MNYTVITLENGILNFHVEGPVEVPRWRDVCAAGVQFLQAQGGGTFLVPHPPSITSP